jgi:hypothetical protein
MCVSGWLLSVSMREVLCTWDVFGKDVCVQLLS